MLRLWMGNVQKRSTTFTNVIVVKSQKHVVAWAGDRAACEVVQDDHAYTMSHD